MVSGHGSPLAARRAFEHPRRPDHHVPRARNVPLIVPLLIAGIVGPKWSSGAEINPAGSALMISILLLTVGAQIYRYFRVSSPSQRQQTKWVVLGLFAPIITMALWTTIAVQYPADDPSPARSYLVLFGAPTALLLLMAFPVSVAFSVLRYRLWDIDVVVNRALVYGLLTAFIVGIYVGSIIVLQGLFRATQGQGSDLVIVASTLAIAAIFRPLKNRIQTMIDRRFYRQKYDAVRTVREFGDRTRADVGLERIGGELLAVVGETVQPSHASLWLRRGAASNTWDQLVLDLDSQRARSND